VYLAHSTLCGASPCFTAAEPHHIRQNPCSAPAGRSQLPLAGRQRSRGRCRAWRLSRAGRLAIARARQPRARPARGSPAASMVTHTDSVYMCMRCTHTVGKVSVCPDKCVRVCW